MRNSTGIEEQERGIPLQFVMLMILLMLAATGLLTLYSASYNKAISLDLPADYYAGQQAKYLLLGIVAATVAYLLPLRFIKVMLPPLLIISLVLMLLTLFTGLGVSQMGARRWIEIGPVGFQPSELVKVSVILFLAHYFSRRKGQTITFYATLYPLFVVLLFGGLILLQRDFSTTLIFIVTAVFIFIIARIKASYLIYIFTLLGVPGVVFLLSESYRLKRIVGFLFRDIDPAGINYQVNAAAQAIAAGGVFGKGFGAGVFKLGRLPEVHSDFIFASCIEETGLVGGVAVIALFTAFGVLGFYGAACLKGRDNFLYYAGSGLTALILWQAMMNIAVVTGLVPPTGIPLPFFSQGGTSLVINVAASGLIVRVLASVRPVIAREDAGKHDEYITFENQEVLYE